MRKSELKAWGLLFLAFLGTVGLYVYVNPNQIVRPDLKNYKLVSTIPQYSEHVIGYGIDIQEAEVAYISLRKFLAVTNINRKIYIYRAEPMFTNGAIAVWPKSDIYYVGMYQQDKLIGHDIIVYNGNSDTLYHELTHFFFAHNTTYYNSEICAQLVVKYLTLATKQKKEFRNV